MTDLATILPPPWMPGNSEAWEYTVFRAVPDGIVNLESLQVGDIDGDGRTEVVTGGDGALIWYRATTAECGVIAYGHHGVAIALEDIDGDGLPEVVTGRERHDRSGIWQIVAFKAPREPGRTWEEWVLVPRADSEAHDIAFADLDGDGVNELIVDAPYCPVPGTLAYKRGDDYTAPWTRHELVMGIRSEAVAAGDLDGDGRVEIVHGPDWYTQPSAGPFSGPWKVRSFAPSFRDMGRVALFDITGNGTLDIVCSEAEYGDGRLSWFENRLSEDPEQPWIEHPLDYNLYFVHSVSVWRGTDDNEVRIVAGEMDHGGYQAARNRQARLLEYHLAPEGPRRRLLSKEAGTHEARIADIDDDGVPEIVGKNWREPSIQIWRSNRPSPFARFSHGFIDRDRPGEAKALFAFDVNGDGKLDVVSGSSWYENPDWERRTIPGVSQALGAVGDEGLLATLSDGTLAIVSLAGAGPWKQDHIGYGGDVEVAVALTASVGAPAMIVSGAGGAPLNLYHRDPAGNWSSRVLGELDISAGITVADLDGDGRPDLLLGTNWLRNQGDGSFSLEKLDSDLDLVPAATAVGDVDGDGKVEIVVATHGPEVTIHGDEQTNYKQLGRLLVLRRGGDGKWQKQLVDSLLEPSALAIVDLGEDGGTAIVCGEHDPSWPYRSQSRLIGYRPADPQAKTWIRHTIDDRFEHDRGPCVFEITPGRIAIASHGSSEPRYINLWS